MKQDIRTQLENDPSFDKNRIDVLVDFYETMTREYNAPILDKNHE